MAWFVRVSAHSIPFLCGFSPIFLGQIDWKNKEVPIYQGLVDVYGARQDLARRLHIRMQARRYRTLGEMGLRR